MDIENKDIQAFIDTVKSLSGYDFSDYSDKSLKRRLSKILLDHELTPESLQMIPQVINTVSERDSLDIGIYGHTDRVGSETYKQTLSMQRAFAVQAILVDEGVSYDDTETASHGEGNPLIDTPDGVAEPRNRRVEIIVR